MCVYPTVRIVGLMKLFMKGSDKPRSVFWGRESWGTSDVMNQFWFQKSNVRALLAGCVKSEKGPNQGFKCQTVLTTLIFLKNLFPFAEKVA